MTTVLRAARVDVDVDAPASVGGVNASRRDAPLSGAGHGDGAVLVEAMTGQVEIRSVLGRTMQTIFFIIVHWPFLLRSRFF